MRHLPVTLLAALALPTALLACGGSDAGPIASGAPGMLVDGGADAATSPPASVPDAAPSPLDGPSDAAVEATPGAVRVLAYYTGDQSAYDALTSFHASLTTVSADVFAARSDGTIAGGDALDALAAGKSRGLDTFACIANYSEAKGDFDAALAHAAIVTHRDAMIASLVKLAKTGYRGVNIDFEGIAFSANVADDRAAFSAFIHDLAVPLHAAGLQLMISVPAKTAAL